MELHPLVLIEWREDHCLSRRSLIWIHDHADPDDSVRDRQGRVSVNLRSGRPPSVELTALEPGNIDDLGHTGAHGDIEMSRLVTSR